MSEIENQYFLLCGHNNGYYLKVETILMIFFNKGCIFTVDGKFEKVKRTYIIQEPEMKFTGSHKNFLLPLNDVRKHYD